MFKKSMSVKMVKSVKLFSRSHHVVACRCDIETYIDRWRCTRGHSNHTGVPCTVYCR